MFRAHLENVRQAAVRLPAAVTALHGQVAPVVAPHAGALVDEARALLTPAGARRFLGMAEPFLVAAAQRAGAGAPEILLVLAGVKLAHHLLGDDEPVRP